MEPEYKQRMNTDRGNLHGFAALRTPAGYAGLWEQKREMTKVAQLLPDFITFGG
jgi:hypothetical protein